jgi:hypothetical protein
VPLGSNSRRPVALLQRPRAPTRVPSLLGCSYSSVATPAADRRVLSRPQAAKEIAGSQRPPAGVVNVRDYVTAIGHPFEPVAPLIGDGVNT